MTGVIIFVGLGVFLLLALLWLLRERREQQPAAAQLAQKPAIEGLFPLHCRYFPQVRQALSPADQEYLHERASSRIRRQAHAERQKVTWQFLSGLREDFLRLDRLGRTVAALAPRVNRKLEGERFRLGLQFRFLHWVVQVRLMTGSISVPQLARLTDLLGSLAAQIEAAMAALEETSMARLRSSLSP